MQHAQVATDGAAGLQMHVSELCPWPHSYVQSWSCNETEICASFFHAHLHLSIHLHRMPCWMAGCWMTVHCALGPLPQPVLLSCRTI